MHPIEEELGRVLVEVAEQAQVPRCDAQALVLSGRREVRRSRARGAWWSVAGVAAVAVVVAGTALAVRWTDSGAPSPDHNDHIATHPPTTAPPTGRPVLASLPRGAAPDIPYWSKGVYHLGDYQRPMTMPSIWSMNGTSLVDVPTRHGRTQIYLVNGQHLVPLTSSASSWPVISSDGRLAAWKTAGEGTLIRLVLWDLTTNQQVATQQFEPHPHCCEAPVSPVGIDGQGRVYVWDGGIPQIWDPSVHRVQEVTGVSEPTRSGMSGVSIDGPIFADFSTFADKEDARSIFGTVDAGGVFHRLGRFPAQRDVWSPDGRYVAYQPINGSVVVRNTATRARVSLGLPLGGATLSVWEDATHLLVTMTSAGHTYWLRCDVVNGEAEVAAVLPKDHHLVLPN